MAEGRAQQVQIALLVLDGRPVEDAQLVQAGQPVEDAQLVQAGRPAEDAQLVQAGRPVEDAQLVQAGQPAEDAQLVQAGRPVQSSLPELVLRPIRFSTWVRAGQLLGRVARVLAVVLARFSRQARPKSRRVDSVANAHPAAPVWAPVRDALPELLYSVASGRAAATVVGRPWLTEANCSRFVAAWRTCCTCAATGPERRALSAAVSAATGRTFTPPGPPLKLTWFVVKSLTLRLYMLL